MNVLVDTSVWSLALRRKPGDLSTREAESVQELRELIREGRARLLGLTRQELLSGIKSPQQFEKLRDVLKAFVDEPVEARDYESAARASNECSAKGITVSVVDVLMCAVAIDRGWSVFTLDGEFSNYAKALPIRLHRPRH